MIDYQNCYRLFLCRSANWFIGYSLLSTSHINEDKRKTEGQKQIFDVVYEVDGCPVSLTATVWKSLVMLHWFFGLFICLNIDVSYLIMKRIFNISYPLCFVFSAGKLAVLPPEPRSPGGNNRPGRPTMWPWRTCHTLPLQWLPRGENAHKRQKKNVWPSYREHIHT